MAQLFKWTVTRCFPIVRDGNIKGAGFFEIVYLPNNFRNTSPMKRVKTQATFKNTYKTAIGNGIKLEVALSMVILAPISQFGCFKACCGVTRAISAAEKVRNGPPDAVKITFSMLPGSAASKT